MIIKPSFRNGYAKSMGESKYPTLWHGLIRAWIPALGVTGNTLHDVSNFKNHGTLTDMDAGTDWIVSQGSYVLDFDGTDDYIDLGVGIDTTSIDFTFLTRVNANDITQADVSKNIIFENSKASNKRMGLRIVNSTFRAVSTYPTGKGRNSSIITQSEHQIVYTKLAGDNRPDLYVDGILDNAGTTGINTQGADGFHLGHRCSSSIDYFTGMIGGTLVYARILTLNEIIWFNRHPLAMFELR